MSALASALGGRLAGFGDPDTQVSGVTAASSQVRPGDLFAAVPGAHGHGVAFVSDALAAGAVAVLTDPTGAAQLDDQSPVIVVDDVRAALGPAAGLVYGSPSSRLSLIGVTGTSGKTTTTYLMRAGLQAVGVESALLGTVATLIGDDALATGFTTPEAPELQALLAVVAERRLTWAVMEVSSHALAMDRVAGVDFELGAFTNLSQDHLDFHADMEDYFEAKAKLFGPRTRRALAVIDDDWGRRMARRVQGCVTASADGRQATWRAVDVLAQPDGSTSFRVLGPEVDFLSGCAIPGRYNVANALVAIAALAELGIPAREAAAGIARASVPGRMQRVEGAPFLAVVDYSHKPAAVQGALAALRPLTGGRLIVVLGCGGDRDRQKRPLMGAVAARGADLLIVTDDNPRSEDPAAIRRAMLEGALAEPSRGEIVEIGDRRAAIQLAVASARAGDTVLVAGKGHETGQEIGGQVLPFDDAAELTAAIAAAS